MPADRSDPPRRNGSISSTPEERQREVESKRNRGRIACAECSRLKLRCDKKLPCTSCVRRGCADICPNKTLALGQGPGAKYVLADTEQLHSKLAQMSERIRQLEDALAIETAGSPEQHPLLRDELLAIKSGIDVINVDKPDDGVTDDPFCDDFGSLTVSEHGVTRFLGRTGGYESLLEIDSNVSKPPWSSLTTEKPTEQRQKNPTATDTHIDQIILQLPSRERGWALCEHYLNRTPFHILFADRQQVSDELFTPIYQYFAQMMHPVPLCHGGTWAKRPCPHELAVFLMALALGALADLSLPPYNDEADWFYQLSRSLITFENAADNPSLAGVQAFAFMAMYTSMSDRDTVERPSYYTNAATFIGDTIGLHRDPARWGLDKIILQRRRYVFWRLFILQNWQALAVGRPLLFRLELADCQLPDDEETSPDVVKTSWVFEYARDILYPINNTIGKIGSIRYAEIMELDRKLREFPPSLKLRAPPHGPGDTEEKRMLMQRFQHTLWRDGSCVEFPRLLHTNCADPREAMLLIHRAFFAKALLDFPANPLRSPYASSFLSTYSSALSMLKVSRVHYELYPNALARSWMLWKHVFSALVTVGTIVLRGPNSPLAPSALIHFTVGTDFFERSAANTYWARRALSLLLRLRDQAFTAYSRARGESVSEPSQQQFTDNQKPCDDSWEEELAIFAGRSWLLKKHSSRQKGPVVGPSAGSTSPSGQPALEQAAQSPIAISERDFAAFKSAYATVYTDSDNTVANPGTSVPWDFVQPSIPIPTGLAGSGDSQFTAPWDVAGESVPVAEHNPPALGGIPADRNTYEIWTSFLEGAGLSHGATVPSAES